MGCTQSELAKEAEANRKKLELASIARYQMEQVKQKEEDERWIRTNEVTLLHECRQRAIATVDSNVKAGARSCDINLLRRAEMYVSEYKSDEGVMLSYAYPASANRQQLMLMKKWKDQGVFNGLKKDVTFKVVGISDKSSIRNYKLVATW